MSCLGVHFALSDQETKLLIDKNERGRLEFVQEVLEETYLTTPYAAQTDKSWDAMHRLLSDGCLTSDGGEYPLNHTILAGRILYTKNDYIMSLKTPDQVKDIAQALRALTEESFRARYQTIPAGNYDAELSEDDFGYTWSWFQDVRELYALAAVENKHVLFTADQ